MEHNYDLMKSIFENEILYQNPSSLKYALQHFPIITEVCVCDVIVKNSCRLGCSKCLELVVEFLGAGAILETFIHHELEFCSDTSIQFILDTIVNEQYLIKYILDKESYMELKSALINTAYICIAHYDKNKNSQLVEKICIRKAWLVNLRAVIALLESIHKIVEERMGRFSNWNNWKKANQVKIGNRHIYTNYNISCK